MTDVRLQNLDQTYRGGIRALQGVSLEAADGAYLVIVGPSGSGKTTLLRLIAGLDKPTSGTISIGGCDMAGVAPHRRGVAMVFQDASLYPHMTARANLAFGQRMQKAPASDIDRGIDEMADRMEIREVLARRPGQLSGGERQRVALGKALLCRPKCLLLDEPLSDLDAPQRRVFRELLADVHRQLGTTTIHVTHDQEEAMALGDQVAVLADGQVQQVGPPQEVYQRPSNRFVAGFIGSPPMNILPAQAFISDAPEDTVVGVRPEALRFNAGGTAVTVTRIEPLGDRADVYLETADGALLLARVPLADAPGPGSATTVSFDRAQMHLFQAGPFGPRIESG